MSTFSRGNVNEESRGGREGVGGGNLDEKEEEKRERKQKSQPTRSKSGTKYTACSLDSVFLQKEKEDGILLKMKIDAFCRNICCRSTM